MSNQEKVESTVELPLVPFKPNQRGVPHVYLGSMMIVSQHDHGRSLNGFWWRRTL